MLGRQNQYEIVGPCLMGVDMILGDIKLHFTPILRSGV
jgi:hypothetical protein